MARAMGENRRRSTIIRDNEVHKLYDEVRQEAGKYFRELPRSTVYAVIGEQTGLCAKTIAYILNHTRPTGP